MASGDSYMLSGVPLSEVLLHNHVITNFFTGHTGVHGMAALPFFFFLFFRAISVLQHHWINSAFSIYKGSLLFWKILKISLC